VGGNIAGALMKDKSLGMLWNTVVGVVGGGVGSQVLGALGVLDGGGMIANIGGSTVGGALLLFIVSLFKK
ncbi:MAG: GlsB/YeaQ/YmgE family stress response membrane protein, partial [Woeseiaceae bacterium]